MRAEQRSVCGNRHVHKCLRKPGHTGLHQCGTNYWDGKGRGAHAAVDALREALHRSEDAARYWNKRMAEENVRGNQAMAALHAVTDAAGEMRDAAADVVVEAESLAAAAAGDQQ